MIGMIERPWHGFHAFPVGAAGRLPVRAVADRLVAAAGSNSRIVVGQAPQTGFTIASDYAVRVFGYRPMTLDDMIVRYVAEDTSRRRQETL